MSDLLANSLNWMPVAVFIAGFVGSAHCAGMCGPLILGIARNRSGLIAYHVGRFLAYSAAGVVAGFIGASVKVSAPPWLAAAALTLAATVLITSGILQLRHRNLHFALPRVLDAKLKKVRFLAVSIRTTWPQASAFSIGSLTVFLPCAHLYTFLAAAVATGSALRGGVLMASFSISTLPALGFGLSFVQRILAPSTRSRFAGVLLIVAGLTSLAAFAANLPQPSRTSNASQSFHEGPAENPAKYLRCH